MTVERVGAERIRRVTNGYLRSSGPNGVIPAGLGRLWGLRARELRFNRLTRAIPPDLGEIGTGLQNLQLALGSAPGTPESATSAGRQESTRCPRVSMSCSYRVNAFASRCPRGQGALELA